MLVTSFRLKAFLYKIVCGFYQAADVGRIHPMRERSLRALARTVDYIERVLPDALAFESQRDLIEFALSAVKIDGHYMEFGVFRGGSIRFIARHVGARVVHGFDSFEGLPAPWFTLRARAFDQQGHCRACRVMCICIAARSTCLCPAGSRLIRARPLLSTSTAIFTARPTRSSLCTPIAWCRGQFCC